jgi:hypothetical protein
MAIRQSAAGGARRGGLIAMLQAVAAFVLLGALIFVGALPLLCLFLPAILALAVEREPGRPMTRTLLLFGTAGAWDPLSVVWQAGSPRGVEWMAMLDARAVVWAWLAQAAGWLLAEGIGLGLVLLADRETARIEAASRAEIAALTAEWNLGEVADRLP